MEHPTAPKIAADTDICDALSQSVETDADRCDVLSPSVETDEYLDCSRNITLSSKWHCHSDELSSLQQ